MKSRTVDEFYGTGNYKREDSEADSCAPYKRWGCSM